MKTRKMFLFKAVIKKEEKPGEREANVAAENMGQALVLVTEKELKVEEHVDRITLVGDIYVVL